MTTNKGTTKGKCGMPLYNYFDDPITFEEILCLWLGEKEYKELCEYDPVFYDGIKSNSYFEKADRYTKIIRGIEAQINSAILEGRLYFYDKITRANKYVYLEVNYNYKDLFYNTRDGWKDFLYRQFSYYINFPNSLEIEIEQRRPLYFKKSEIIKIFPFLFTNTNGNENLDKEIKNWENILFTKDIKQSKRKIIKICIEKLKGKTHIEAYNSVLKNTVSDESKEAYVRKIKKDIRDLAEDFSLSIPTWAAQQEELL